MVRVFSHWLSPRKAAFFVAEEAVLVLALLAGASIAPVAHPWVTAEEGLAPAFIRAAITAVAFGGALYFGDLYDLRAAAADRADGRKLLRALGVAMLTMAVAYLVLPLVLPLGVLARRSLVLAEAGGAFAVILVRAVMPAVVGSPVRVLFLGSGARARQLARDVEADADGLFDVVGFRDAGTPREGPSLALAGAGHLVGRVDQEERQHRVIQREDAARAARVKSRKVAWRFAVVEQDAADQEPRQDEEQINTGPGERQCAQGVRPHRAWRRLHESDDVVPDQHHRDRQSAHPIQLRNM